MKALLIGLCSLLLASCSLFERTPDSVVRGQRAIYQSVAVLEQNTNIIIDRYVEDTKKAVTYHLHFVCEKQILDLQGSDYDEEYINQRSEYFRSQRDRKIKEALEDIDEIALGMREQTATNHQLMRKLIGAVYNYLSTTPIEVDDIDFWIDRLKQASEKR